MRKIKISVILFLSALYIFSDSERPVFAQMPPVIPSGARAEVAEKEAEREALPFERERKKPVIEDKTEKAALIEDEANRKIKISRIKVEGYTLFPEEDMRKIVYPYEGTELTIAEMNAIAEQISALYRKAGYISSFAYIPPQKIDNERVTINVVEGRLGEIRVEGARYFRPSLVRYNVRMKEGDIVDSRILAEDLERLNTNPSRAVQAVLAAGKDPQTSDIILKVMDEFPLNAVAGWNNRGTRTTGYDRFSLTIVDNNFTMLDDMASATVSMGKRSVAVSAGEQIPITNFGTVLGYNYSKGIVWPGIEMKQYDMVGHSNTQSVYVRQDLSVNDAIKLNFLTQFDYIYSTTKMLGGEYSHDDLRVLKQGFSVSVQDKWGINYLNQDFSFGIPYFLGASGRENWDSSRRGAGGRFFVSDTTFTRVHPLPHKARLNTTFQVYLTDSRLPSSQQFYLGGSGSVRGYPEYEYSVDNGFTGNFEVLVPFFFTGDLKLPFSKVPLKDQLQFTAFFDMGWGWLRPTENELNPLISLAGTGAGLRLHLWDRLYARIELGIPMGKQRPGDGQDVRLHFSIQTELF